MASEFETLTAIGSSRNPVQETRYQQLLKSSGGSGAGGFSVPNYQKYYDQAYNDLQAYYARILQEERGDVEMAKRRLMEDYQRGNRITMEDYTRELATAEEQAGASTQELAFRTGQERRGVETDLLQRGISQGGVAGQVRGEQKTSEQLRQEAIDRALNKSRENLTYAKERSLEEGTIEQKRGTEDVASAFRKFVTAKGQERQEKAAQLADSAYNREFGARQAKASFDLAQQGLDLQKKSFDLSK